MKKALLTTIFICTLSLTACGSKSAPETTVATTAAPVVETTIEETIEKDELEEAVSAIEAVGSVTVEKELFDVKLTIPADFIGETTQEELEAEAKENGYKVVLNEDGSATYEMTKSQHKKMMEEIKESLVQSITEMVGSEEYPNFTDIKYNDDFTEFTITTKSTELDMMESISTFMFYMSGGLYNIYNGTPVDNVHLEFVNADSGEVIYSSDSSNVGK